MNDRNLEIGLIIFKFSAKIGIDNKLAEKERGYGIHSKKYGTYVYQAK